MKYILPLLFSAFIISNLAKSSNPPMASSSSGTVIDLGSGLLAFSRFQNVTPNEEAPIIFVFHGRGGSYKSDLQKVIPTDIKARIFFIQGHIKNPNGGYLFFEPRLADDNKIVTTAIKKEGKLIINGMNQLINKYPHNKIIAFGFSQGAAIALYLGSLGFVDETIAFSGSLPENLYPSENYGVTIKMWHGDKDLVVKEEWGEATADAFKNIGFDTTFVIGKGKGHILPPKNQVKYFLLE